MLQTNIFVRYNKIELLEKLNSKYEPNFKNVGLIDIKLLCKIAEHVPTLIPNY